MPISGSPLVPHKSSSPEGQRLRIGLMLDSWTVPAWTGKIVREIQSSDYAEVVLVVLNGYRPTKKPVWKRLLTLDISPQARRGALFYLYSLLDARLFRPTRNAFAPVNLREVCPKVEVLEVVPEMKKFTDRFRQKDVEAIRHHSLDVLLRFGFRIIRGDILSAARYGVWSYHHGDNLMYRGTPALFWEMYERHPVSGVVLQILTDELDGGKVIYRSHGATWCESLIRQRNATYWKAAQFVGRRLRDLYTRGWDHIRSLPTYNERPEQLGKIYHAPSNAQMIPFLGRMVVENVSRSIRQRVYVDSWAIAWRRTSDPRHLLTGTFDKTGFQFLRAPADRYYADPIAITFAGKTFLFFEDFRFSEQKGVVSCAEMTANGPGEVHTVLERPYHLSYPFVFEHNGEVFMTPETGTNRTVELYRATSFPHGWKLCRVLLENTSSVDPTLFQHDGRWWMFANGKVEGGLALEELFLYYSDSLEGPWTPHPDNPVVSDIRRARPAGPVLKIDGALIRPAQDCTLGYGRAVRFQRITKLTPTDYEEETVNQLEPPVEPGNAGIHTYTFSNGFEIIDVKRDALRTARTRPRSTSTR